MKSIQDPIKLAKRRKNASDWYHQHKNNTNVMQRRKEWRRIYYEKNKEIINHKTRVYSKEYIQRKKSIIIWHYSGGSMSCECCNMKDNIFLTIDHIENNGAKLRYIQGTGTKFYNWLLKNSLPNGFQILCWNCNSAKALNGGICPHKEILSK